MARMLASGLALVLLNITINRLRSVPRRSLFIRLKIAETQSDRLGRRGAGSGGAGAGTRAWPQGEWRG